MIISMRTSTLERFDKEICGTVWTSPHARELLDSICYDFGTRPCASKGFRGAQQRVGGVLRKLGATKVHTEKVPVLAWRPGGSQVEILGRKARALDHIQCPHSAAATVTAPVVDAGLLTAEDLDDLGGKAEGAILLYQGHAGYKPKMQPPWNRVPDAQRRGAVGAINRSLYPGSGPEIQQVAVDRTVSMPVVSISREQGFELAALVREGKVKAKIETTGRTVKSQCSNLVADFGPARKTEEMIVITAHLDCHHNSTGALDNLSGVVTILEILRALAPMRAKFRRHLRIAIFTCEEYGYSGSRQYVKQHADELDRVRLDFNFDCIFPETGRGVAVMWSPVMRDVIEAALGQTQCRVEVQNHFCQSSDYLSFMTAGVPAARAADLWDSFPPNRMHTRYDTPDRIPTEWIRLNAMPFAQMLLRLLLDPKPLPAVRNSPEEVRALYEQEGIGDALRIFDL